MRGRAAWCLPLLVLLLGLLQATQGQSLSEGELKRLVNKDFSWQPLRWEQALKAQHPRLYLANIWQMARGSPSDNDDDMQAADAPASSAAAEPELRVPITLFTALSIGRLKQLQRQCEAWPGPMVAAVWSPLVLEQPPQSSTPAAANSTAAPKPAGTPGSGVAQSRMLLDELSGAQSAGHAGQHGHQSAGAGGSADMDDGDVGIPPAAADQMEDAMAVVDRALYKLHKMRSGAVGGGSRGAAGARRRPASQGRGHTLLQTTPDQASGSSSTAQAGTAGEVKAEQQEGPVEADDLDLGDTIAEMLSNGLGGCDLTVLLFVQPFADDVSPKFLFPINALRNYAGMMARTPLVTMVDVDLVPNAGFARSIASNATRLAELEAAAASGSMFVMPAFEAMSCDQVDCTDGLAEGLAAAAGEKSLVRKMFLNGSLDVFHCNKGLHYAVDYRRWLGPTGDTQYEVSFAQGMEPWYIGHRSLLPLYDVRFIGFGFNKQLQVMYAAGNMGMRVMVLPDAWLVHLPHAHTVASKAFDGRLLRRPGTSSSRSSKSRVKAYLSLGKNISSVTYGFQLIQSRLTRARAASTNAVRTQALLGGKSRSPKAELEPHARSQVANTMQWLKDWIGQQPEQGLNTSALHRLPHSPAAGSAAEAAAAQGSGQLRSLPQRHLKKRSRSRQLSERIQDAQARMLIGRTGQRNLLSALAQTESLVRGASVLGADATPAPTTPAAAQQPEPAAGAGTAAGIAAMASNFSLGGASTISAMLKVHVNERYASEFKQHIWALGSPLRYYSKPQLPPEYKPVIDPVLGACLKALPWWSEYRARWKAGDQPGPGDVVVNPPAMPKHNGDDMTALKRTLHICTPQPARKGALAKPQAQGQQSPVVAQNQTAP